MLNPLPTLALATPQLLRTIELDIGVFRRWGRTHLILRWPGADAGNQAAGIRSLDAKPGAPRPRIESLNLGALLARAKAHGHFNPVRRFTMPATGSIH